MAIIEELAKKTSIAGKNSNVIGEKDSPLILRGQGIKILWGNKFIDLVKNGKINVEQDKILKTIDSVENITSDGIYLIEDSVWVVIGGTKVEISGDSTNTYVSYLVPLTTTPELKKLALTNIGFYYDTYEQALNAGLTSGMIYVLGDNKLYIIKEGILTEYVTTTNTIAKEDSPVEQLYISENSLEVDGEKYITCDENISIHKLLILTQEMLSQGATSSQGFRLYTQYGQSYLEIDNLTVRNTSQDVAEIYPIKYYQEDNIILAAASITLESSIVKLLRLTLLYSDKYKIGDILTTSMIIDQDISILEGLSEEIYTNQILIPIDFKIDLIEGTDYIVSTESDKINLDNIEQLINKSIFYKQGLLPVARIQDHNYDLFDSNTEQTIENISTRIGSLSELGIKVLENNIVEDNTLGIYSNNSILKNSNIIESKQYGTIFKPYTGEENIVNYPLYDETLTIPSDITDFTKFNLAIPNIEWIKQLMDLLIPKGTIVMWSGSEIPEGWVMCDGKNGTPNLIGKFIKASDTAGNTGGNNSITLSVDNLPDHLHGISEINTSSDGGNIHTHTVPNLNLEASNTSISDSSIVWKTVPENTEGLSDITTTKGQSLLSLTSGDAYIDTDVLDTDYSHSVNIPEITTSATTIEAHTHSIESHNTSSTIDANNSEINIEPEYFSLIFIMKL